MGINRGTVLDLISDVHRAGGFKDYNSYSYLFNQVDTMPESKEDAEPHWIPVTENCDCDLKYHVEGCFEGEIEADSREEAEMNFHESDIDSMDITAVWEEEVME